MKTFEAKARRLNKIPGRFNFDNDDRDYVDCVVHVETKSGVDLEQKHLNKKYNLKVGEHDLVLLDEVAKFHGIARTAVIDQVIFEGLLNELMSIPDLDKRTAVAMAANELAGDVVGTELGWLQVALHQHMLEMANWCFENNIPDPADFHELTSEGFAEFTAKLTEIVNQ